MENEKIKIKFKNCITGEIEEAEIFKEHYELLTKNLIDDKGYILYNPETNVPKEQIMFLNNEKLKYTVIYGEAFQVGSHRSVFTRMAYIEVNTEEEMKALVEEEYGWGNVYFLFKGHCEPA